MGNGRVIGHHNGWLHLMVPILAEAPAFDVNHRGGASLKAEAGLSGHAISLAVTGGLNVAI